MVDALSTPSWADGSTYRGSSLTSLNLQAKGSEYSLATRRRVPERKSPHKRHNVGVRNSSSGPCVLNLAIEPNPELLTIHFCRAAKVIHRGRRGSHQRLSSSPVNNFGGTISARYARAFEGETARIRAKPATLSIALGGASACGTRGRAPGACVRA